MIKAILSYLAMWQAKCEAKEKRRAEHREKRAKEKAEHAAEPYKRWFSYAEPNSDVNCLKCGERMSTLEGYKYWSYKDEQFFIFSPGQGHGTRDGRRLRLANKMDVKKHDTLYGCYACMNFFSKSCKCEECVPKEDAWHTNHGRFDPATGAFYEEASMDVARVKKNPRARARAKARLVVKEKAKSAQGDRRWSQVE